MKYIIQFTHFQARILANFSKDVLQEKQQRQRLLLDTSSSDTSENLSVFLLLLQLSIRSVCSLYIVRLFSIRGEVNFGKQSTS